MWPCRLVGDAAGLLLRQDQERRRTLWTELGSEAKMRAGAGSARPPAVSSKAASPSLGFLLFKVG